MSVNQSNGKTGCEDSTGGIEPQHPPDPIARNPKDIDKPEGTIQATEVSRCSTIPALAASHPFLPDQRWGLNQPVQAVPSATELLTSILRFKWTLLLVAVLVSAPVVAAIWTQIVPKYQARAEVRVRPIIPRLVFKTDENGMIPLYDSFVNTQVSLIRGLTVLQRVLDQQEVQETQWYKDAPGSLMQRLRGTATPPMERLRDSLSARPRPRTEIIDVSFIDARAKDAKLIVDTVLNQYMKYIGEMSDATEDKLYRQLVDQYKSLENEIQGREKICAELHRSLGTETPQDLISGKRVRLDETQARLGELRNRIAVLEWEMKQAVAADSNAVPVARTARIAQQPKYHEDAEWRKLKMNVDIVLNEMAKSVSLPDHPEGIRLRQDLNFARDLLRQREAQLDEQWRDRLKNAAGAPTTADTNDPRLEERSISVEHQLARAKREEQLLSAELEKQQAEFKGLFESAQLLEKENNALRQKRELFDAVRQRLDQKNMERNVPGSIEVSMWAYSPSQPEKDRRTVFTAMALVLGLGMGGGAAFLRASRNQTIYAPKDMPQPMQVPFLGCVPLIRTRKPLGRSLWDEIEQDHSLLIESIRVMRTALFSRLDGQSRTTVLITSAATGTGKSSFTVILGKCMARAGKKVLIVDADFHKMTLSKWFDLLDQSGFMEFLSNKTVDRLPIFATETPGLNIMPAGKRSNDDAVFEEIANGAFKICIGQLFKQYSYDIILLDTPPILPVADAAILAGQVDGTIMVEREHVSRRTEVANALIRLSSAGGRLLGTVFVGSAGHDHYGYGYSYGHYGNKTRES